VTRSYAELRAEYAARRLSPVEVAREALARAEAAQRDFNCFALIDHERALAAARASENRWRAGAPLSPLDGMPVGIKEFAQVEGWPTRYASAVTGAAPAPRSTPFAARLLEAGAVAIGKTRAPEFNWKGVTDSPAFGVTRNPLDPWKTPGGSSGGCAAAVASGVVRVSVGSDAGGSVRIPAAFSGVLGLKPSFGRIPMWPNPSHFSGIAHVGPLAASTDDLGDALAVMSGPSVDDWTAFDDPDFRQRLTGARVSSDLRIGLLNPAQWRSCAPEIGEAMAQAVAVLGEAFQLRDVSFDLDSATFVADRFYRLGCAQIFRTTPEKDHALLDPGLRAFVQPVAGLTMEDYIDLMRRRDALGAGLAALFQSVDALVLPTVPIFAFEAGRNAPADRDTDDWMGWNPFTPAFNLLHVPALSVPLWPQGSALPAGLQLVARFGADDRLVALARWLEAHPSGLFTRSR
jgi:aspartyl-tRNA(Asn)/glutamyl-tRNA(Gln) amidotransferase subunit A